jgi:putative membrane protein
MEVSDIPAINAALNAVATVMMTAGFFFIRRKQVERHRACMVSALIVSIIFLISYVLHKVLVHGVHTPFGGDGPMRTIYYIMLASHIVLAMIMGPLILRTFLLALRGDIERHRKWARWTFPIWYYVSVTGVLIYFFIYVWYPGTSTAAEPHQETRTDVARRLSGWEQV